jgi:hypothetical protein
MYEIDTKTGGHDMTTIYRGVEVAPLNNAAGSEIPAKTVSTRKYVPINSASIFCLKEYVITKLP